MKKTTLSIIMIMYGIIASAQILDFNEGYVLGSSDLGVVLSDVEVDVNGNTIAVGSVENNSSTSSFTMDVDPTSKVYNVTPDGVGDGTGLPIVIKYNSNGDVDWAFVINTTSNSTELASVVETDASGNIYVAGWFHGTNIDFNPLGTATTMSSTSLASFPGVFYAKYNSSGILQWAKSIKSGAALADGVGIQSIQVASNGDSYISGTEKCGSSAGSIDFGGTSNTIDLTSNKSSNYIAKYNSSGTCQWVMENMDDYTQSDPARTRNLIRLNYAETHLYNVVSPRQTSGTWDVDPTTSGTQGITYSKEEAHIVKYTLSTKAAAWYYKIGSGSWGYDVIGFELDNSDNIYLSGYSTNAGTNSNWDISGTYNMKGPASSAQFYDVFIAKFDDDCEIAWGHVIGSSIASNYIETNEALGVNKSNGDVYVSVRYNAGSNNSYVLDPDPNSGTNLTLGRLNGSKHYDVGVVKYNSSGSQTGLWALVGDGTSNQKENITAIIANNDDLLVVGSTRGYGMDLDYTSDEFNINAFGSSSGSLGSVTAFFGKVGTDVCETSDDLPTSLNRTYESRYSNTDGNGWTNYCSGSGHLLLSLKLSGTGAVVEEDEVQLKTGSSTTYSYNGSDGGLIANGNKGYAIIDRLWDVSPSTQPTSDVPVRYYFTASEYSSVKTAISNLTNSSTISAVTDLQMFKADNGSAFDYPHTSGLTGELISNGSTPGTNIWALGSHGSDHYAEFKVSSFSGGGGGGGGGGGAGAGSLPVEFVNFSARPLPAHNAKINWATATEINNSHFVVERSYDGLTFEAIESVEGNGNSQEILNYAFLDNTISENQHVVYYRLNQFDYDGANELSEVRKVIFDVDNTVGSVDVYPNPFNNTVFIQTYDESSEYVDVAIKDLNGRLVYSHHFEMEGNLLEEINVDFLISGMYMINISTENSTKTFRVLKQ